MEKGPTQMSNFEGFNVSQQHATERALVELFLPCIDQSSDDSRNAFARYLIKQRHIIEQQINTVTRGTTKQAGAVLSGVEGPANKGNKRKGMRGGNPGLARRPTGVADSARPSPAALRASMALGLQFLLRLLPIICAEGMTWIACNCIRWRIQAAMPILVPSGRCSISCQPPSVSSAALASLQPSLSFPAFHPGNTNQSQRNSSSLVRPGKLKNMPLQQDHDIEIDPWRQLEDGAGAGPSSGNTAVIGSGDHANLRASNWLRGTVRVRRTGLTYIGAADDDS